MSRKSCRQNINRLRIHRTYTMAEIAQVLGCHVGTVRDWHKDGLEPINIKGKPFFFLGSSVRNYYKNKRNSKRYTLKPHEFNCLRCRTSVSPSIDTLSFKHTNKRVGKSAYSIHVIGICPNCGAKVTRIESTNSIIHTPWNEMFEQAKKSLIDTSPPHLNTDKTKESSNGKLCK